MVETIILYCVDTRDGRTEHFTNSNEAGEYRNKWNPEGKVRLVTYRISDVNMELTRIK